MVAAGALLPGQRMKNRLQSPPPLLTIAATCHGCQVSTNLQPSSYSPVFLPSLSQERGKPNFVKLVAQKKTKGSKDNTLFRNLRNALKAEIGLYSYRVPATAARAQRVQRHPPQQDETVL